jgi:hypothetical protein
MKPLPVQSRYLISIKRPGMWLTVAWAIFLLMVLFVWLAFDLGRRQAGFNSSETRQQIAALQHEVENLTRRNNSLHREKSKLVLDNSIDNDASSEVKRSLATSQTQITEMKEELLFYRNIVSPRKSTRAVVINKVVLTAETASQYKYKVVLIQDGRHNRAVRGSVEISLEGEQTDGQIVRLDLPTISVKKVKKQQKFGFKYFQNFEGVIRIPEDFVPISLYVRAIPKTSKVPRVEKTFPWAEITAGGD